MNIGLVRESFEALKPYYTEVVEHFYSELFNQYPQSQFWNHSSSNDKRNRAHFLTLAHVIEFFEDNEHVVDYLRKIGRRQAQYGAEPEHFQWIADALRATLAYYFHGQWTSDLEQSWTTIFDLIKTEICTGIQIEKRKIIEMKQQIPSPSTISEIAHNITQELLKRAIENEVASQEFKQAVREKAQELLYKAIQEEAIRMLTEAHITDKSA